MTIAWGSFAVGLGYVVVVFEDDKVCVVAGYYFAFAFVCA